MINDHEKIIKEKIALIETLNKQSIKRFKKSKNKKKVRDITAIFPQTLGSAIGQRIHLKYLDSFVV